MCSLNCSRVGRTWRSAVARFALLGFVHPSRPAQIGIKTLKERYVWFDLNLYKDIFAWNSKTHSVSSKILNRKIIYNKSQKMSLISCIWTFPSSIDYSTPWLIQKISLNAFALIKVNWDCIEILLER